MKSHWLRVLIAGVVLSACTGSDLIGSDPTTPSAPDVAATNGSSVLATTLPADEPTTPAPTTSPPTTPPTTQVSTTSAPVTIPPRPVGAYSDRWERVAGTDDCECADGSEWSYFVHTADTSKVLFYLEGGGACFSTATCNPVFGAYTTQVGMPDGFTLANGVFDLDNAENPFADYSIVYVPYCTGDVHAGDVTGDYGDGLVVEHKGFVNGSTALAGLVERFGNASAIVVAGVSAGGFSAPVYAGMLADELPNATVKVVADGSGAIPDEMGAVSENWGLLANLPEWPGFEGATYADVTPSWLFTVTAEHQPTITFARHDYANDLVLNGYAALAGVFGGDLTEQMSANEAAVESTGADMATWIAPGSRHTVIGDQNLYVETLNGVRFVDWLTEFVEGSPPADEHCPTCG